MKTLTIIIALVFSLQSFASTGLKSVVDEYRYFVTVEWDQKDLSQLELQNEVLIQKLSTVSHEEKMAFLRKNLSPEQLEILSAQVKNASKEELAQMIVESSKSNQGASWVGAVLISAGVIAVSLVVLYTVFLHMQLECDGLWDCHGGE